MTMDGLHLVIGKAPSELSESELVAKVSLEIERVQEGLKQPLRVKGRSVEKAREKAEQQKKSAEVLAILGAAGITPQQYIEMMKEKGDD